LRIGNLYGLLLWLLVLSGLALVILGLLLLRQLVPLDLLLLALGLKGRVPLL
jgi:hypothetical protein